MNIYMQQKIGICFIIFLPFVFNKKKNEKEKIVILKGNVKGNVKPTNNM